MPQGVANVMTDVFRDFSIKLKMNEAFYSFLMWEELRRILVKTIISLCSHSLFKMFSQLVQSSCSCSTKHMWLWTQTAALTVHDLVCPGPPLPHL